MATWTDVKAHLRTVAKIVEIDNENVKLEIVLADGRTQLVFIRRSTDLLGNEIITFSSPFATVEDKSAHVVLNNDLVKSSPFGVKLVGDFWTIQHVAFTATLDELELLEPIRLISVIADTIEENFGGGDRF